MAGGEDGTGSVAAVKTAGMYLSTAAPPSALRPRLVEEFLLESLIKTLSIPRLFVGIPAAFEKSLNHFAVDLDAVNSGFGQCLI